MTEPNQRKPGRKRVGACSECGNATYHMNAKTCGSQLCRGRRERRLKKVSARRSKALTEINKERADPDHLSALRIKDELQRVAREELRPVVREAITEDVLRAAQKLVALTPIMVDLIAQDMAQTTDKELRQKAYTLALRYTLGNTSIAPKPEEPDKAPMQVVFQLPRPGSLAALPVPADDGENPSIPHVPAAAESVVLQECNECHEHKAMDQFVGASDRCQACHDEVQSRVTERFGQL